MRMLKHVVLLKVAGSAARALEIVRRFELLTDRIPEVASFEGGPDVSIEGLQRGYSLVFVLGFESEADRQTYLDAPSHVEFADWVQEHAEDVMVLDYWVGG